MADIRPTARPIVPTPAQPVNPAASARSVAQQAFFQAALGKAQGASAAAAPSTVVRAEPARPAPQVKVTQVAEQAETPQRYLRPGSLLDIKV